MVSRSKILENWYFDHYWTEKFSDLLTEVDAISFDVFDTALTRVLDCPGDVFALTEEKLISRLGFCFTGYAAWREEAEREARGKAWRKGLQEIRFTDILDALVSAQSFLREYRHELFETEMQAERECCFAVPEIKAAYELCREKGIPVLFVSDMYLPASAISDLLRDAGYGEPELVVSCETGSTKSAGSQWQYVKERLGRMTRILHIGDNDWSDGETAEKAGLLTLPFKRACSNHRPGGGLTPSVLPFSRLLRKEILARKPEGENYNPTRLNSGQTLEVLGASWGAMVVGAYVCWIARRAQDLGLSHIYFCARDGWLPQRAWHAAALDKATGISSSYLYISRRSLNFAAAATSCTREYLSERALDTLCGVFRSERLGDILDRAGLLTVQPLVDDAVALFGSLDRPVSWDDGLADLKACMRRHASSVYPVLQSRLLSVVSYLCQEGLHQEKAGIVDIGWHGTLQVSMREMLKSAGYEPEIYGLYAWLWPGATSNRARAGWMESAFHNDYQTLDQGYGLYNNVAIIENTFSASEGTTIGYEPRGGRITPILASTTDADNERESLLAPFQDEAVRVINDLFSGNPICGISSEDLTTDAALAAISRLGLSPTESEIAAIGSIHHAIDPSHMTLTPIVRELSKDFQSDDTLDLSHSDWIIGSALTALKRTTCPQQWERLAANIRHQLKNYDPRTLGQFR